MRSNKLPLGTCTAVSDSFDVTDDTNIHSQSAYGSSRAASSLAPVAAVISHGTPEADAIYTKVGGRNCRRILQMG